MLQPDIPDSRVLDLFSGSGALGPGNALARSAGHVTFVEQAPRRIRTLCRRNIDKLDADGDQSTIVQSGCTSIR